MKVNKLFLKMKFGVTTKQRYMFSVRLQTKIPKLRHPVCLYVRLSIRQHVTTGAQPNLFS
jgi:hypothetical protein